MKWYIAGLCILVGLLSESRAMSLEERVANLQARFMKQAIHNFKTEDYRNYVTATPRNYSIVVMLTALKPNRGCQICRDAHYEYKIVAESYRFSRDAYSMRLFFGVVDFDDASDVFKMLNLNSAPVIIHIPPGKSPKTKPHTMDISRVGYGADAIANFINEKTDIKIFVVRPPSYAGPAAFILLFILVGSLLYMKRNNLDFLYNRTAWGIAALCIIFAFLSGQMWNHIRGPPFMHRNHQTGQIAYISGSSQMQFVVETYIVMLLYMTITVGFILMNEAMDTKGDPTKKRVMAFVGLGVVVVFFSLILSVFRSKYSGYPYSFLFK